MQIFRLASVGFAGLLLAGCSITYDIAGYFENSPDTFAGTVSVNMADSGRVAVANDKGDLTCEGTSKVIERPSGFSTIGARAVAEAKCNDGRTFKAEVIQDRDSGGSGQGLDDKGNVVKVFFDRSRQVAVSTAERERLRDLTQSRAAAPSTPVPAAVQPPPRAVAERLRELDKLRDDKLVTPEEYDQRRKAILNSL